MSKARATSASYPIRAVSRMTGIGIDTLRAWERRHGAVTPIRDDRGRMYTDADVARLRLLQRRRRARTQHRAARRAHQRGTARSLWRGRCRALPGPTRRGGRRSIRPRSPPRCSQYDASAIDQEISPAGRGAASARTAPRRVDAAAHTSRRRLAPPADAHRAGAPDVLDDAEHARLVSPAVRAPARHRPGCSLRPPPASATRSRRSARRCWRPAAGLGVSYLGPDLPAREIVESVEPAGAQVLVLGLTDGIGGRKARERELKTIVRELPNGRRVLGRRTRRRASRLDHQAAGVVLSRLQRIPTGTRPHRRTGRVTPMTRPRLRVPSGIVRSRAGRRRC